MDTDKLITDEEIKKIKSNPVHFDRHIFEEAFDTKNISKLIVEPTLLKSGFKVSYSIDEINPKLKYHHISISKTETEIDFASADKIAERLLGKGYEFMGAFSFSHREVLHYIKVIA